MSFQLSSSDSPATSLASGIPYDERHDVKRVVSLPIVRDLLEGRDDEELEAISRKYLLAPAFESGFRLFHTQANALRRFEISFEQGCGGFYPVGVGWGKTGISLMLADQAFKHPRHPKKVIMLCIPPNLVSQLVETDVPFWRARTPISYSVKILSGRSADERLRRARLRSPGLYIVSYSQLSAENAEDLLEALNPDMVILDEAQNVMSRGHSARTSRFFKHMGRTMPILCGMSGTMTQKSPMDFHRMAKQALRDLNFMPNSFALAGEWSAMMDASVTKEGDTRYFGKRIAPVAPLLGWAKDHLGMDCEPTSSGIRQAFQARMATSPGVYASADARIAVALEIRPVHMNPKDLEGYEGWDKVTELKNKVDLEYLTPNGDQIDHAIHKFKWLSEIVGGGYYNELVWPERQKFAGRKGISINQAESILERSKEYHSREQHYTRLLREYLQKRSKRGMDTPMLLGMELSRNGISNLPKEGELYRAWLDKREADFEDRAERDSHFVFLCDFKIVEVLRTLAEIPNGEGCVVWYESIGLGKTMYDYAKDCGFDALHFPSGPKFDKAIQDPKNKDKVLVASLHGHGTGKNLQYLHHQIFLQWPRSAQTAEQTLGRLHRNGQQRSRIQATTLMCDVWDDINFAACLNDAAYVHQSMGTRHKLICADYDPAPRVFPSHVLEQMGAEAHKLNKDQQELMQNKFGKYQSLTK